MTNGEKIQTILDVDRDCIEVHGENGTMTFTVTQDFWNAECKEPATKECQAESDKFDAIYQDGYNNGYAQARFDYEQEPTTNNDLGVREFEEIVVEYPPEELCIYPEYKGKPYFGIKYKENGEEIVGYGTYNPEVLSQYLKDYFISTTKNNLPNCQHTNEEIAKSFIEDIEAVKDLLPTTKNDLGVDLISREDALMCLTGKFENREYEPSELIGIFSKKIKTLPSVTPQEPKPRKGKWLRMPDLSEQEDDRYECSRCGNVIHHKNKMDLYTFNSWCGRCGSNNGR